MLRKVKSLERSNDVTATAAEKRVGGAGQAEYVSYSANMEDVILRRIFAGRPPGFFVDVGAADPTFENDTKLLYDAEWHGINVEPNPLFFKMLVAERPRDRNFSVVLGDRVGSIAYYDVVGTGLSTCDRKLAERARDKGHEVIERNMEMTTLARVLDEVKPASVELLKVDVEGFEEQVLAGNDWSKYRPSVILVEATHPESPKRRPTGIRADLEQRNYRWRYFDGLNDYYVSEDFSVPEGTFDSPPNIFDRFKLLAVANIERQRKALQEECAWLRIQLQDEKFERLHLMRAAARMQQEMIQYSRELEKAHRDAEELAHTKTLLSSILSSTSWTLSAPIRAAGRMMKRPIRTPRA